MLTTSINLKKTFSFRLGTTSYIIPADMIPNVEHLANQIDDIELLFFESEDMSELPGPDVIQKLDQLRKENDLSYTVHLPLDIQLGSADESLRKKSVWKCLRVLERAEGLHPFAYNLHINGDRRGLSPSENIGRWREAARNSIRELLEGGFKPFDLCVEFLSYPFDLIIDLIEEANLSICLDLGHAVYHGYPVAPMLDRYFSRTRVIHLHGVADGHDHRHLGNLDPSVIELIVKKLNQEPKTKRVLTMEIFGQEPFDQSIQAMSPFKK